MQVIQWHKNASKRLGQDSSIDKNLSKKVERIIQEVRQRGDAALTRFTKEFDRIELPLKRIRVSEGDINLAFEKIEYQFVPFLKQIMDNVKKFYQAELKSSFEVHGKDGILLEKRIGRAHV